MLVVAEPPSPLPRGPCPRAMRAAKSNVMRCKRMAQAAIRPTMEESMSRSPV